jgi:pimeloyl-ACP methyl ester carboxylesterase
LPVHLSRHSEEVATYRTSNGLSDRTVIGLGHSFGAVSTLFAALTHPALFKSLVLVEAVVGEPLTSAEEAVNKGLPRVVVPTISRPSVWSSMDDARKSLSAFPVFRGFNKSQMAVYLETAVHTLADGSVTLKQDPIHEAILFEVCAPAHAWTHAPFLDERVDVHWIRGSRPSVFSGSKEAGDEFVQRIVSQRKGRGVSEAWVEGGHLLVQDNPKATGPHIR